MHFFGKIFGGAKKNAYLCTVKIKQQLLTLKQQSYDKNDFRRGG